MDPSFKELFTFTSGEKKGLLVLTGIIILLLLTFLLLPILLKESESSESQWIKEMSRLNVNFNETPPTASDSLTTEDEVSPGRELFEFDPNLATEQNFKSLGLTSWQIKIIEKYRKRGGKFRTSEDFGKIYGIGVSQYEALKPFIHIQSIPSKGKTDTGQINPKNRKPSWLAKKIQVEINSCDSVELDKLYGVGKTLAARIIKYRDRLGGFARLDQLLEVYGLKSETYSAILPRLVIDTNLIKRIKINSIDYNELRKHPYLNSFQAKGIIKYRELRGNIKGEQDLAKNNLLSGEVLAKIGPYLSFE